MKGYNSNSLPNICYVLVCLLKNIIVSTYNNSNKIGLHLTAGCRLQTIISTLGKWIGDYQLICIVYFAGFF